ncbi:MAG: hypothetical protein ACOCV2_02340 [Persicimonas sp.]
MEIKRTLKRPAVVWTGLTILLIIGALLVPMEWVDSFSNFLGEPEPSEDAFSEEVARVDEALREGEDPQVDGARIADLAIPLQIRRLLDTGPMTAGEVREATEMLEEYNGQIASQKQRGSRDAVRSERNKQLTEAFPRLDREAIDAQLEALRDDLRQAGHTDLTKRL